MSALDVGLIAQLVAEPTRAEQALRKIVNLFADNARMSGHELRVLEITLEGLGVPACDRRLAIEAAIQRKRDRLTALHGWPDGGNHA